MPWVLVNRAELYKLTLCHLLKPCSIHCANLGYNGVEVLWDHMQHPKHTGSPRFTLCRLSSGSRSRMHSFAQVRREVRVKHVSTFLWNTLTTELSLGCTQPGPWNQRAAVSFVDIVSYTYFGALLFIKYLMFQCSKFKDMYLFTKFNIN